MLNACRRQRISHNLYGPNVGFAVTCSTPVGVKGSLTSVHHHCESGASGAQRLSASKDLSHDRKNIGMSRKASCSTPVGVKGSLTDARVVDRHCRLVLNACRRQRISHRSAGSVDRPMRVVLNACRRQRISHVVVLTIAVVGAACSTPVGVKGSLTFFGAAVP
ncbi:hypothetical protein PLANPX_0694 [Lacipirellula parvula]|uniref:Uncharacterized protein n=1 Tax=Lacipirellula parvula TaxID=2650471 RepID=A0A5K7X5H3_9BACT|nr:hypothetical protein PLANPX_0694 [Lacipirellula parvula]